MALVWGINQTEVSSEICKSWEEEQKCLYTYTFFLLRYINIYKVWLMKMTHPYPEDKKVILCVLKISTISGAFISS